MSATVNSRRAPVVLAAGALCALAALVGAPAQPARAANLAPPIRAVFLKEFSRPDYSMVQGQLLILDNADPFLAHGLAGALTSEVANPGKERLVRNSPYLGPGVYPFYDPLNPTMQATLTITPGASPPPDTTAPTAKIKVLPISARKFASGGKVRVRVTPSEAADVDLKIKVGKHVLVTNSAAYADPVPRVISLIVPTGDRRLLSAAGVLAVKGRVTDVTGKADKLSAKRRLGAARKKK